MEQKAQFGYAETASLQVLDMPYAGGDLSMVIVLPKARDGITQLEHYLTTESLGQWLDQTAPRDVIVMIPKFTMTRKFSVESILRSMGMTEPFSLSADFSGMTGKRDLFISAITHQAYVEVNEEGTVAAAATGMLMDGLGLPEQPPVFRADHPFLFLICDRVSGSILFLGRVMNPQT